jgi:hypothetical protein
MNPEIYLDMDGLLVNLFDTLGHKFFNKPYKQLTLKQKKQIKKVWLDKEQFVSHFGPIEYFFESWGIRFDPTNPAAPAMAIFFIVDENTIKPRLRVFLADEKVKSD